MSAWATVGAKCVCIRTAPEALRIPGAVYPEVDGVYTVRKVVTTTFGANKGEPSILLFEIVNDPSINPMLFPGIESPLEVAMPVDAFRPLVAPSQEDDVALIKSLLVGDEVDA